LKLQVHRSREDLAAALAQHVVGAITMKPDLTVGLPAGRTPILLYAEIVAASRTGRLDWSRVRTFNLDEFVTPDGPEPQPFRQFMHDQLLSLVAVPPTQVDWPNGRAADLAAECDRYEGAIASAGGLDLVLLGIGANGHIGFNEPGSAVTTRTHVAQLTRESLAANAWLFGHQIDRVPAQAITMGIATILGARSIVLVATGTEKATAAAAMIDGAITSAVPASFLQLHPDVTVLLDEAAGRLLLR
jgi:glucosamine-6-phosphate deaminase